MSIRNAEPRTNDSHLERLRRKRDQAWELAECARRDGDTADAQRYTAEALEYAHQISEYLS